MRRGSYGTDIGGSVVADPEWDGIERRRGSRMQQLIDSPQYRLVRDGWLVVITIVVAFACITAVSGSNQAKEASRQASANVAQIQRGRRIGTKINCAALGAVSQAGRQIIENSAQAVPPRLEHALEALGFPPVAQRIAAAKASADAYVRAISSDIDRQIGQRHDRLVRSDGTIDCHELERLTGSLK